MMSKYRSVALRLTIWFLLLSFLPLAVMAIFVRHRVTDTFMELTAHYQYDRARLLARNLSQQGNELAMEEVFSLVCDHDVSCMVFVVDNTGTYISHPDPERVGTSMLDDFSPELFDLVLADGGGAFVGDQDRLIGYADVPESGINVISVTDRLVVFDRLSDIEQISFLQLSISLVAISLLGGFIIWIIAGKPIRQLTRVAAEISKGNFDVEVDPADMEDELEVLARTFNQMASQIRGLVRGLEDNLGDLKRVELALRESEARFRLLARNMPVLINAMREDGSYIFWNRTCEEVTGYSAREIIGNPDALKMLYPDPEYRDRLMVEWAERGNSFFDWEMTLTTRAGEQRTIAWYNIADEFPIPGWATWAVGVDVTERVEAEGEIMRLQHLLQSIADSMPSALITVDLQGHVLTWNPAAERLTGRTESDMVGQPLWEYCPIMRRYQRFFQRAVRSGEVVHRHKDRVIVEGEEVYQDVSVFPLVTEDVAGAVLRIDDVTQRVHLEEMMLQSAKMASVGRLAAGMAHEINNPLGAMIQAAQVVEMALDSERSGTRKRLEARDIDPEKLERYVEDRGLLEYLGDIRGTGARAAKIVRDLLGFSRKSEIEMAWHDLNVLVRQAIELARTDYDLERQYDFQNIDVELSLVPNLPPVRCDGQQIQQVVLNLVRNAAQAIVKDGRSGWLRVGTRMEANRLRLEVEDNGPGIPDALRGRLFDPFFTTKDVGEGTGLGLWVCWSIVVERHGGRIWMEDGERGGARFVVELSVDESQNRLVGVVDER